MDAVGILALLVIALAAWQFVSPHFSKKRRRKALMDGFGKTQPKEPMDPDVLRDIANYHCVKREACPMPAMVDDITWSDLDMDRVFEQVNATQSDVGERVLYDMLRQLGVEQGTLERRGELTEWLLDNEDPRTDILMALSRLGKSHFQGADSYLFYPELKQPGHFWFYIALVTVPFVVLLLAFWEPLLFILYAMMFGVNVVVYYRSAKLWQREIQAIRHLSSVVVCAGKLAKLNIPAIAPELDELRTIVPQFKSFTSWTQRMNMQRVSEFDLITEYVKIMLQPDMISLCRIGKNLALQGEALRRVYALVGELDVCVAAASTRKARADITKPIFYQSHSIEALGVVHPLLKAPVSNSIVWSKNVLITGSNASGKSTFAKAMAVNAILAQSLHLVFAEQFRMPRAQVMSSMAIRDDVMCGDSYFIAEIKSLKRILDAMNSDRITLCFIDEVLRGTNTVERIAASSALLAYLSHENALVMAATHDIELTRLLKESYENQHFTEEVVDGCVRFTYRMLPGPATTRNAILLLGQLGFPEVVITQAETSARCFDERHTWE